jgi:hypothetical protein
LYLLLLFNPNIDLYLFELLLVNPYKSILSFELFYSWKIKILLNIFQF